MQACVFGAGAVGGHIAARLAKAGARVSVVARGPGLAAMRRGRLRVEAPGEAIDAEIAASDDPAQLGPQDVVIVTVKAPALPSVAAMIGPLLGPETPVVFAMNGMPMAGGWTASDCRKSIRAARFGRRSGRRG